MTDTNPPSENASATQSHAWMSNATSMQPFLPRVVDWFLKMIGGMFSEGIFKAAVGFGLIAGELLLYLAIIMFCVISIIGGARSESFRMVGENWLHAFLVLVLSYVALKLMSISRGMIPASPSKMGNPMLLNCVSGLALGFAVFLFIKPFFVFHSGFTLKEEYDTMLYSFAQDWFGILCCVSIIVIANRPAIVNVTIEGPLSAAQEALGIIAFVSKAILAIAPIIFAVFAAVANIGMIVALISTFQKTADNNGFFDPTQIMVAEEKLMQAVMIPIMIVLGFLLYQLIVDLCRSVLRVNDIADAKKV